MVVNKSEQTEISSADVHECDGDNDGKRYDAVAINDTKY